MNIQSSHLFTHDEHTTGIDADALDSMTLASDHWALTSEGGMRKGQTYHVAQFRRRRGELSAGELLTFSDEAAAFRQGKAMMNRVDGLVFFKIECGEDGDVWSEVETLATVGDVPPEADEAA